MAEQLGGALGSFIAAEEITPRGSLWRAKLEGRESPVLGVLVKVLAEMM